MRQSYSESSQMDRVESDGSSRVSWIESSRVTDLYACIGTLTGTQSMVKTRFVTKQVILGHNYLRTQSIYGHKMIMVRDYTPSLPRPLGSPTKSLRVFVFRHG
jgi:hypothetical protein